MNSLIFRSFNRWTSSRLPEEFVDSMALFTVLLPPKEFVESVPLGESAFIEKLLVVAKDLLSSFSAKILPFHHKNFQFLIWKVEILIIFFDEIQEMNFRDFPVSANLCIEELYLLFYQTMTLLDYCVASSRMWILFQSPTITHHIHDICKELLMVLDVFPFQEVEFCDDLREHIELLKKHLTMKKVFINPRDEVMRIKLLSFVVEFEAGRIPVDVELKILIVDMLEIRDAKTCIREMNFLLELIRNHEEDLKSSLWLIKGIVAVMEYCGFLFFGLDKDEAKLISAQCKELQNDLSFNETIETFAQTPKDFLCPISLEVMQDPVTICTGQTYDRASITDWIRKGNNSCPATGQLLDNTSFVPNRAVRSIISKWCIACDRTSVFDLIDTLFAVSPSKAFISANKAMRNLFINLLSHESIDVNIVAAHKLHLLAKSGEENRAYIAEAGAVPLFQKLILSSHPIAQKESVKSICFLCMHESNKVLIMEQVGESLVHLLRNGFTSEAREDAAITLSCLCTIRDYRTRIADFVGAVDAILRLMEGRLRGRIVAVRMLMLLSEHVDNCSKLIEAGCIKYLTAALWDEETAERAVGIIISLTQHPFGAEAVKNDRMAIGGLLSLAFYHGSSRERMQAFRALRLLFPDLCCVHGTRVFGLPPASA